MTDIVERLRKAGLRDGFAVILYQHVQQAADEIERLRAALQKIIDDAESDDGATAWDGSEIARAALEAHK